MYINHKIVDPGLAGKIASTPLDNPCKNNPQWRVTIRKLADIISLHPVFGRGFMCAEYHLVWEKPRTTLMVVGLLLLGVVGCSGETNPFPMTPVSGTVTYEDGSLIAGSEVWVDFVPQVEAVDNKSPRPGRADVNVADGTFDSATTETPGDGVIIGEHQVSVSVIEANGRQTQLTVVDSPITITEGGAPLAIKVKKP